MPRQPTSAGRVKGLCLLSLDPGGARGISQLKILAELMNRLNYGACENEIMKPCDVFDMIGGAGSGGFIAILLVVLGFDTEQAVSYRHNIAAICTLRNFEVPEEQSAGLTIAEALLATIATPPLFQPTPIHKDSATVEYVGGDLILGDPTRNMITEAQRAFGSEKYIACLLNPIPIIERLATDSEQQAQLLGNEIGHLGIYHRYSVTRGLEHATNAKPGDMLAHTAVYLADVSVSPKLDFCVESLKVRDGVASFDQIKQSHNQSPSAPVLPPLTRTFVMRKEPWEFVEKALLDAETTEDAGGPRMLTVTGIGGSGKTQLILKFMRVHGNKFSSLFFIDGCSESRIRADIVRHVRSLGWMHSQKNFDECLRFLSQPSADGPRLILYDNVDDPSLDLSSLLPDGDSCAIIVTSRNRLLGELSPDAHLELDVMSIEESMELLLGPIDSPQITEKARDDGRTIAEELGYLPIALTQARSYMFQTKCDGAAYLERLRISKDKLLAQPIKHRRDMRYLSTHAAFSASFDMLPPCSQKLLRLLSCCYRSKFPLELILLGAKHRFSEYLQEYIENGEEFQTGKAILEDIFLQDGDFGPTELDEMMVSLQNYSLVTLVPGVDTILLQMHLLAHEWVRSSMPEHDRDQYQSAAMLLVAMGARRDRTPSAQYLENHVTHMSPFWDNLHIHEAEAFARILHQAGFFGGALRLRLKVVSELRGEVDSRSHQLLESQALLAVTYHALGRHKDAMRLQEEVLALRKEILGESHLDTLSVSSSLASTYLKLGRLDEARILLEEVLRLRKEILGEHHPGVISALNDLASIYYALGLLGEARVIQEEVLRQSKEILGERHPHTITALDNLAGTYSALGRFDDARILVEEVLRLRKEILGKRHPDTISASNNLAISYSELGRLDEARILKEEVLSVKKEILGGRHPYTISASNNLAISYSELGLHDEARVLQEEVLRLRKEILGERHPDAISSSTNLAYTYSALGLLHKARALQEEVLGLSKEILGERHSHTITASNNLAGTYSALGRLDDARLLVEEVLRLRKEILGKRHPDTIAASNNLANTYSKLGRLDEARILGEEVLSLRKEILGDRHPDVISASNNLANTYYALGLLDETRVLQEDVLRLRKEILGEHHPDTISASNKLAITNCGWIVQRCSWIS